MAFNTSKGYLQIDIKTTYISAMNQDEKVFCTLKKWLITLQTKNTEKERQLSKKNKKGSKCWQQI